MDCTCVFRRLPPDLQHIVIEYDRRVIFNLSKSDLDNYDWFKLIKRIFSLSYDKSTSSGEQIMNAYMHNCRRRSNIICGYSFTIVRTNEKKLMSGGLEGGNNFFKEIILPGNVSEIIPSESHLIIKSKDGTLMRTEFAYYNCHGNNFEIIGNVGNDYVEVVNKSSNVILRFGNGTLMVWGKNKSGQLGIGHALPVKIFETIPRLNNVVEISCSDAHTIIKLRDGTLLSSGSNTYGELGLGDNVSRNIFCEIKHIPKNISKITCGANYSLIHLMDGTLMICGVNSFGNFGLGDSIYKNVFHEIGLLPKNIVDVFIHSTYSLIRLTDGTLMSCGNNQYGELGLGDDIERNLFCEIRGIPKNIVEIACGSYFTIIRLTDGTLMGCGWNGCGQLGLDDTSNRNIFERIPAVPKNISEVKCGGGHTIIQLTDGTIMGCGHNGNGQLGLGDTICRTKFEKIFI
ncbi:MAG: chromosome condensation regulator [Harvfovirus sp.]|uniref:Chromosome condensation regulator n=1 Tax=Harvfovirus sp. TaxID=2487768 RepID=A0A3G5A5F5_9VIRU|nr:MAG: chromosome condensation regulator [Harvfovirus sp.]